VLVRQLGYIIVIITKLGDIPPELGFQGDDRVKHRLSVRPQMCDINI
jgi:hypothetical protein